MPTIAPLVALSALAILGTAVTPAAATTHHPDKPVTCRGKGVAPDALVRARTETVIHAPLSTIWKLRTDVERWPSWQPPVSTKYGSCIRWTGPAIGEGLRIDGVHVRNFTKVRGGVRVTTEETHTGPQVEANVPAATEILSQGLKSWLTDLKATAEAAH